MQPGSSDATANCPNLSSLPACNCHITTIQDPTHFTPSGNYLTIACGDKSGTTQGPMDDTNVDALVGLIPPTTPMEAFGIYYQPSVYQIPDGLSRFTNLKAVSMFGNGIYQLYDTDFSSKLTWPGLQEINLQGNRIRLKNKYNFTYPFQPDGSGYVYLDLSNNQIGSTEIRLASFFLSADSVTLDLSSNIYPTITSNRITMPAKKSTFLNLGNNPSLTSVKLAADTNAPLSQGQTLLLSGSGLTGTIDCNDLGINSGVASFKLDISGNTISGVNNCGAGSKLDNAKSVSMDWSANSFTSLPAGAFNFAANVSTLKLNNQKTPFTSIAPGAMPSE